MRSTSGKKPLSWKPIVKVLATCVAIYWVGRQISFDEILGWMVKVPVYLTLAAFILFNLSKMTGAIRLNQFFRSSGIDLSEIENIKLYYKGMLYNFFLPGGIGGDGYKVFHLSRSTDAPWRKALGPIFWDRLSGAVAMVFIMMVLTAFHPATRGAREATVVITAGLVMAWPAFSLLTIFCFPAFRPVVVPSSVLAVITQVLQMLVALVILSGMAVSSDAMLDYIIVFLASSLATIIPFTIGGIGIRELVFITAAQQTAIEKDQAVAFSLIFFAISAISSLAGALVTINKPINSPRHRSA